MNGNDKSPSTSFQNSSKETAKPSGPVLNQFKKAAPPVVSLESRKKVEEEKKTSSVFSKRPLEPTISIIKEIPPTITIEGDSSSTSPPPAKKSSLPSIKPFEVPK